MAAYNLGQCYESGRGVPRNMAKAVFWWRKAAKAGYPKASTNLGSAYFNGEVVKRNRKKALHFYGEGSIGGDKLATRMLNKLNFG